MRFIARSLVLCALAGAIQPLAAQTYPARPVTMVVPLQAGSSLDVALRIVTQKMSENMGQSIITENQPGAAGMISAEKFMRATPDGYTLAMFNDSVLTMVPNLQKKVAYDPVRSFAPIGLVADNSWVLVAHPSLPATNVSELIALAKAKPGAINYTSGGNGSPQHIAMVLFQSQAGINLTHIPYKGTTQATLDVMAGQVPLMFSATNAVLPQIREGKLRALATGGRKRSPLLPAVPTVAESIPGFEFVTWAAIFAPLNTPKDIITRVNSELIKALNSPDVRDRLVSQGLEIEGSTPEHVTPLTAARLEQMRKLMKAAGVTID